MTLITAALKPVSTTITWCTDSAMSKVRMANMHAFWFRVLALWAPSKAASPSSDQHCPVAYCATAWQAACI